MLVGIVVCCSHQSDCCIRVCILPNQIAVLGYVSRANHITAFLQMMLWNQLAVHKE